ncbi:uncharacterized protein LOC129954096 [Eupeodes corollae]|uniref:uncharacterized protein LOC129954096 n=1 Tax=Eupeodes corollae TaxID=290404 RepID=UPI002491151F|nr:uncharacterized protein LOC129954096 [Eupeodes corollae]
MALAKEESLAKLIFNFSANTQKAGKAKQTKGYLVGRRKLLEEYWTKFNEAHDIISSMDSTEINEKDLQRLLSDERFAEIESAYCEALGDLNEIIDELSTTTHEPMSHSTPTRLVVNGGISTVKSTLPPLQLPTFDGSFEEWLNFKDMFTSCVINDKMLSDIQRLHYLNCSLRGSATSVLKNIRVSEDNFQTAWDILKGRYDNKRKLIKQYLYDIVNLPTMVNESHVVLRQILDEITEAVRSLQHLGRPTNQLDDWLILHVTQKLDPVTIKYWETSLDSPNSIPTYLQLEKFLENKLQGLDAMAACSRPKQNEPNQQKAIKAQPVRSHQANVNRCPKCSGKHVLMFCSDFRKETPAQRMTFVTKAKLCKNCLKADHAQQQCRSDYTCLVCHQKHHTMLHNSIQSQEPHVNINTNHLRTNSTCNPAHPANSRCENSDGESLVQLEPVLLATAQVGVQSATGHKLKLRALLDIGSQATFISEYAVQQLHLQRTWLFMPVTGVGGTSVGKSTGLVDISVSSLRDPDFNINCRALILPHLGPLMPTLRLDTKQFGEFMDLELADPDFCEPGSIDVILGADVYGSLLYGEILQSSAGAPVAQHTHLGWIIFGRLPESTTRTLSTNFCAFSQSELADLVQSMWKFNENEDVESSSKMTQDEL